MSTSRATSPNRSRWSDRTATFVHIAAAGRGGYHHRRPTRQSRHRMTELHRSSPLRPAVPAETSGDARSAAGKPGSHHGPISRLRNYFLTGLVLVGPLYITVSLTWWFVNWVDDVVRPFIPVAYRPETYLPVKVPGMGLVLALFALTMLGFLTANLVGRKLVAAGENILHSMPVVRPIYKSLKQIFETLFAKGSA